MDFFRFNTNLKNPFLSNTSNIQDVKRNLMPRSVFSYMFLLKKAIIGNYPFNNFLHNKNKIIDNLNKKFLLMHHRNTLPKENFQGAKPRSVLNEFKKNVSRFSNKVSVNNPMVFNETNLKEYSLIRDTNLSQKKLLMNNINEFWNQIKSESYTLNSGGHLQFIFFIDLEKRTKKEWELFKFLLYKNYLRKTYVSNLFNSFNQGFTKRHYKDILNTQSRPALVKLYKEWGLYLNEISNNQRNLVKTYSYLNILLKRQNYAKTFWHFNLIKDKFLFNFSVHIFHYLNLKNLRYNVFVLQHFNKNAAERFIFRRFAFFTKFSINENLKDYQVNNLENYQYILYESFIKNYYLLPAQSKR